MRLACKFGNKRRFTAREYESIYQELVDAGLDDEERRDPAAIEAVFKRLNEIDEIARARRMIMGGPLRGGHAVGGAGPRIRVPPC
jgi:hypothetical protein